MLKGFFFFILSLRTFNSHSLQGFSGTFISTSLVKDSSYENAAECKRDKGRWKEKVCYLQKINSIVASKKGGRRKIFIRTFSSSGEICEYSGHALIVNGNSLVSTEQSELSTKGTEKYCTMTIFYKSSRSVSFKRGGNCSNFCGEGAEFFEGELFERQAPKSTAIY